MQFRDGVVWQVGDRGRLYTSPDLDQWTPHETGTTKSLRGITFFGADVFVCGEEGTVLAGSNPGTLRSQSISTTNWLEAIAASDSLLVTVGDNGSIYTSTGNGAWTRRGAFTTWLRGVEYGTNQFVCVGEDGFIARSTDGENWEELRSGTTSHLNRVTWLNGCFWVVGDEGTVLTNNFRMDFLKVDVGVTNTLFTVSANTDEVVVSGDSAVLLRNPVTGAWTQQADLESPALAPVWPYYSSLWDGRLFLLSGETGMIVEGFRTNATAPLAWYSNVQPTRSWLWASTRVANIYAAVGAAGTVVTSEDGVEWAREVVPPAAEAEILLGVGGNTNVLITAGSNGTILRSQNALTNIVSTNIAGEVVTNVVSLLGIHWTQILPPTTADLQGVAASADLMVVTGGGGSIFVSANGALWQPRVSGVTTYLSGAAAWREGFVAVGADGVILTSPDGAVWTRRNSGVQDWIYAVRWVGGKLVAVGENGLILTSENGVDWTRRQSGTTVWLNDVTHAQGNWYGAGSRGTIVTSADAVTWTASEAITSNSLYGTASDGEQLILVGMEGTILRKNLQTPTTPVNFLAVEHVGGNSVFLFAGVVDQQFLLEESESIVGPWRPVATLELTDPSGTLVYERAADDASSRFFRTRLIPVP